MRPAILATVLALALCVPALFAADPPETAADAQAIPQRAIKIGYIDLTRVLKGYDRRRDTEKDLVALQGSLGAQERALITEVRRYEGEINQLAMGTPEREDLEKKHQVKIEELGEFRKENYALLNQRFVSTIESLYGDVVRETEALGREGEFDFIIKDQSAEAPAPTHDAIVLQISKRIVLYSRPEYDLTAKVTERLNRKYVAQFLQKSKEEEKAEPAAGPEGPAETPTEKR